MKRTALYMAFAAMICLSNACTTMHDDVDDATSCDDPRIIISYRIAPNTGNLSRAAGSTEPGDNDGNLNENLITRLNLLVTPNDGSGLKNIAITDADAIAQVDDNADFASMDITDLLTYEQRELLNSGNYSAKMIANAPEGQTIASEDDLKSAINASITPNVKQQRFVMDDMANSFSKANYDNRTVITFEDGLVRAAAKIRLHLQDTDKNRLEADSVVLCNYAPNGCLTAIEGGYMPSSASELRTTKIAKADVLTNTKGDIILYSYPNSWVDESKFHKNGDQSTIDQFNSEEPIIADLQTYLLVKAPFNGTLYWYKIPVNFRLTQNNDKAYFTEVEIEEVKDLYRIKRNHLYDITATIDHEGGNGMFEKKIAIKVMPLR